MDVFNKVCIITGASAGIGLATAREFAARGAKLVLAARSVNKLEALVEELYRQVHQPGYECFFWPTDMRDHAAVYELIEQAWVRFGQIDILINNAGLGAVGTVAEINPAIFRQICETNVFGPLYAMQAVVPRMRQTGGGLIINISSIVSKMHIRGLGAYAATKVALNMIGETAREELAADNIRVITVFPRQTATDFGRNALGDQRPRQAQRNFFQGGHGAGDSPELVARKILEAAEHEPAEQYMDR